MTTPPPAERCPRCGNGRGYNHCVCPRCVRCGSSNLHLGQMGSSKCFDCGNIAEAKAPQPEGCIDFPTERKSRAYHSPVFDRAEPAAPSYVCNCGQSFAHEYDRLLHAGDCPSVRKPAAAEVRESISVEEALAVTITLFKECQTERDQLRRELESLKKERNGK